MLEACFEALKHGHEPFWRTLFADWRAERLQSGQVAFDALVGHGDSTWYHAWDSARRLLADAVCDVKLVRVHPLQELLRGTEFEGAPAVRECRIEVEHVGRFDGAYRSFKTHVLHRAWVLQSLNGGPWRILDVRGL